MVFGRLNKLSVDMERHWAEEVQRTGTVLRWTPALRCSCTTPGSTPKSNCVVCKGFGWFWPAEREKSVRGVITQATTQREYLVTGFLQPDDLVFVPLRKIQVGVNDRFRVRRTDMYHLSVDAESILIKRGTGSTDELPYRVARLGEIIYADSRTGSFLQYKEGRDFTVAGNVVTWLIKLPSPPAGAIAPPDTQIYSISFDADYDWLMVNNPGPRGLTEVSITQKCFIRRRLRDTRQDNRPASTGFNPAVLFPPQP